MRILKVTAVIAALVAVLLVSAPLIIQQVMISQVRSMGLGDLSIDDTDFNPFLLQLSVKDFALTSTGTPHLSGTNVSVDLAWGPLMSGVIGVESFSASGAQLWLRETTEGQWVLLPETAVGEDTVVEGADQNSEPLQYWLDQLTVTETKLHVESPRLAGVFELPDVKLSDLANMDGITSNSGDTLTDLTARWGDAEIHLETSQRLLDDAPPFELSLSISGLALNDFRQMAGLNELSGKLDVELKLQGQLSHSPLSRQNSENSAELPDVTLTGSLGLSVMDLQASPVTGATSALGTAALQTDIEFGVELTAGELADYELGGSLSIAETQLTRQETPWLGWTNLDIDSISVSADQQVALQQLNLKGLLGRIELTPEGELLTPIGGTAGQGDAESAAASEPEAEMQPWQVSVAKVAADGELLFVDNSVAPMFKQSLIVDSLQVSDVDMGQPDQLVTVALRSRLDEYARVDLDMTVTPFAENPDFDAKASLVQIPLDRKSVYLEKAIGYEVKTGQLDLEAAVTLADQQVEADIDAMLRRFRVNKAEDSDVDAELGMPLGAALSLVRDGDGNIRLDDIGISGNLGDPSVSARGLIIKAFSKALMAGTMTYFQFALQPYGAAMMAVNVIGGQAGKVALDPLKMVPEEPEVLADNADYMDRLGTLMEQRPGIHLVICGEASSVQDVPAVETPSQVAAETATKSEVAEASDTQDAPAVDLTPQLLALADARAKAVKANLYERGIASDRLLVCKSRVNEAADGARVVLSVD